MLVGPIPRFAKASGFRSSGQSLVDLCTIEKHDVLLGGRPRSSTRVESEAPQRVEEERPPDLDHGRVPADTIVDGDRPRLGRRQAGMRRNDETDASLPIGVAAGQRAGGTGRTGLGDASEDEIAEVTRLAIESACVPAEAVMGKRMRLDRSPKRLRPAHRLVGSVEGTALADRA